MDCNNQVVRLGRGFQYLIGVVLALQTVFFASASVASAQVTGPYHVGLDFIDSTIYPAPARFFPHIEGFFNGWDPFELTAPANNFVTQGGLAGWTEDDARRAVALAVDDVFRDIDTGDPNTRVRLDIHLGAVPTEFTGQRLNVVLGTTSEYPVSLLGSASGLYNDPLMNDDIVAVTYISNIDKLGDSYVTYDSAEDAINAVAGTAAHEIGHVFGISAHVETLPGDTEPYPLVSSEGDGLPTFARLTERRFSTIRPAGVSNATTIYQNAGTATKGDLNFDTYVDGSDAGITFGNWGMTDRLHSEGDVSGDHILDAADLGIMFPNWTGDPGPAATGTAIAEYNPATGEITVSVDSVINWFIEVVGDSVMTGLDSASPPLPLAGGLLTDNDMRIGETNLAAFSYSDVYLGAVAATGLADDGSLKIFWNDSLGGARQEAAIVFVPEPTTVALAALTLAGLLATRRRRVA